MPHFVLSTILEPNDAVDILVTKLIGNTEFVVIAKASSLKVYSLLHGSQIKLEKTINLYETIIDLKTIQLFSKEHFLVVATDSNRILIIGFQSLQDEFILDQFDLKEDSGASSSIQPGTLIVDQENTYIAFFSIEGLFWSYQIDARVTGQDLKAYLDRSKRARSKLFKSPEIRSFPKSRREARTPLLVERLESFNDGSNSAVLVLYRDDLFNYYLKTLVEQENTLGFLSNVQFEEEINPIILRHDCGSFLFGETGIYLTTTPYCNTSFLSAALELVDDSTVQQENDMNHGCFIKKSLPIGQKWDVISATIARSQSKSVAEIILVTKTGEVYSSKLKFDLDLLKGEIFVDYWTLEKYRGKMDSPKIVTQIEQSLFIANSPTGLRIFKLRPDSKSFDVLHHYSSLPSIMDFNISGTTLPKIQICGGKTLDSGYISTEFKGFNTDLRLISDKLMVDTGVLNMWIFGDFTIVNTFDGVRMFECVGKTISEVEDFHGLKEVDGSVLDMNMSHNELTVVTEKGVFVDGRLDSRVDITAGFVEGDGTVTHFSGTNLIRKSENYSTPDDVSTIFTLEVNRKAHILVGYWSGKSCLFLDGIMKPVRQSELAISSALIKRIKANVYYLTGDAGGNIGVTDTLTSHQLNIGDAPVTIVDYTEYSILAFNAENVVRIDFNEDGEIINRGYLNIEVPYSMKYDRVSNKLVGFTNGTLEEVIIDDRDEILKNNTTLSTLVRKSVKFKNFLHLSLFATTTTKYNKILGREVWSSELHVIDNNTFETKFVYELEPGTEITDVVNTEYHKELIDTYEEENIGLGMENILSQCFVVSCAYGSQDEYGPPLMLFSVDESGRLQYQCSSPKAKLSFQSLTNHANKLVIGAGDAVVAYKVEYSIADSKFTLKKASDSYRTRYFTSHIKSVGPDVVVGDIIKGTRVLELKVKDDIGQEDGTIFRFEESLKGFQQVHFLTAMETFKEFAITADSLKNIQICDLSDELSVTAQFNIGDQINVIKKIDHTKPLHRNTDDNIGSLVSTSDQTTTIMDEIVPFFVLGSVNGGIYLLSMVTADDLVPLLDSAQESVIREKHKILIKNQTEPHRLESFKEFISLKGSKQAYNQPAFGFTNGDLIQAYDDHLGNLVSSKCVLL